MSGMKDPHVAQLARMVRHRLDGVGGLGAIAGIAGIGRAHLSQVLNGRNDRLGYSTWARLRRHLTRQEWAELEKSPAWNTFRNTYPVRAAQVVQVPLCDDERQPLMPVLCCACNAGIRAKPCEPSVAGKPSHTYCRKCEPLALRLARRPLPDSPALLSLS